MDGRAEGAGHLAVRAGVPSRQDDRGAARSPRMARSDEATLSPASTPGTVRPHRHQVLANNSRQARQLAATAALIDASPRAQRVLAGKRAMGAAFLPPAAAPTARVIQQKVDYLPAGEDPAARAWGLVQQFERDNVDDIPVEKRLNEVEFAAGMTGMATSLLDFGTIDLASEQQVGLMYYNIRKQAENTVGMDAKDLRSPLTGAEPNAEARKNDRDSGTIANQERLAREQHEQQAADALRYRASSPDADTTVELAILGAGAAAAYYLTSMGSRIDRASTILIGTQQPWAQTRGPGVINHPEHMISVLRDEVGLKDEALMDRAAFSDAIEQVIDARVTRLKAQIAHVDKIEHRGANYYKIDLVDAPTFYAKKVIAGLGIGPHAKRATYTPPELAAHDMPRVMDMDAFQRRAAAIADEVPDKKDITVFIAGGNAAIDVVKTCIDQGFTIIWYPGNEAPQFLQGTDNEVAEEEFDKLQKSNVSKIATYVKTRAGSISENAAGKPLTINNKAPGAPERADYYVYGQGPDVDQVRDLFNKENILDKLTEKKDKDRYFSNMKEEKAIKNAVRGAGGGIDAAAHATRATVGLHIPATAADPTSIEFIGGSAFRLARTSSVIDNLRKQIKTDEGEGKDVEALRRDLFEAEKSTFQGVINSLPNNVVGNDQLAPIRAQVEASLNFVPAYVEDDVNMAVDNITVIAMHIAIKYPHLPPPAIETWADRIIRWRRPGQADIARYTRLQGPLPNPHKKPRENADRFSRWFHQRLAQENDAAKKVAEHAKTRK